MTESDIFATVLSILALFISGITAWLSLLQRGSVCMTKPTFIAFLYDQTGSERSAKVFIRCLIYSTGKRGHVIENMYITVRRAETLQTFNIWGYSENKLLRGSGLFIGETGISADHHFNPPTDEDFYAFIPGEYEISVFVELVGRVKPTQLHSIKLTVPESLRVDLRDFNSAVWFDWEPNSRKYHASVKKPPGFSSTLI